MIFLNSVFGYNNPKLPQDDWLGSVARNLQLTEAKKHYPWTTDVATLPEVPLLETTPLILPYASRPTFVWIYEVAQVAVKIAGNLIAVLANFIKDAAEEAAKVAIQKVVDDLTAIVDGLKDLLEKAGITLGKQTDNKITKELTDALKFTGNLAKDTFDGLADATDKATKDIVEFTSNLLGGEQYEGTAPNSDEQKQLNELGKGIIGHFANMNQIIVDLNKTLPQPAFESVLSFYNELFQTLPLPQIANDFQTNTSFAEYRTQGPNPMLIELVTELKDNYGITEAGYQSVMGDEDSLQAAIEDKRLFVCDYAELTKLTENPSKLKPFSPRFVPSPVAFFALAIGAESIQPVAIQTEQTPSAGNVFYAVEKEGDKGYWDWMQARTIVQNADGNYHELYVHLARTHLVIEAIAVATHRNLSRRHPLWVLLIPHMEGTLFINDAAAVSLISEGGPINIVFGGDIHTTQQVAAADRLDFDFNASMLKKDLEARGVADPEVLPDYPYRDDATLVWNAIENWASSYVDIYYKSDKDVTGDNELNAWTKDLISNGKVKGFTAITTKSELVDALTMIIFTASAQHAAVNFPQRTLMSYPPALSAAVQGKDTESVFPATQDSWGKSLPMAIPSITQLSTLYLLGSVYYRKLGEYRSNSFPYLPWFGHNAVSKPGGPLNVFQEELAIVEKIIAARNEKRATPYPYLMPSQIPPSINI